jgi:hypothetical protein
LQWDPLIWGFAAGYCVIVVLILSIVPGAGDAPAGPGGSRTAARRPSEAVVARLVAGPPEQPPRPGRLTWVVALVLLGVGLASIIHGIRTYGVWAWTILLLLLGVGIVIALAVHWDDLERERRRSDALAATCRALKLRFTETISAGRLEELLPIELFRQELMRKCRAYNVMSGKFDALNVVALDFEYMVLYAKSRVVRRQTMALFPALSPDLPGFRIEPRASLDRLNVVADLFDSGDIRFPGDRRFARRYRLHARGPADAEALRRWFTPEVRDLLARDPGWRLESWGGHVLLYREGRAWEPGEYRALLTRAARLVRLLARN